MKSTPEIGDSTEYIIKDIQFSDIFDLEEIQYLQDLFADVHGVASVVTTTDGMPITNPSKFCRLCSCIIRNTETGRANCYQSDAVIGCHSFSEPMVRRCLSSGLWDASASITVGGRHIANWLIGQVRNEEVDEKRMVKYADEIGANRADFMEALSEVPVMSVKQFKKVSKILFAFANELSEKSYNNYRLKNQILEREKVAEALIVSEGRYRSILSALPDNITITDLEGRMQMVSSIGMQMFGYEKQEELFGRLITDFIVPEDQERAFSNIARMFQNAIGGPVEYTGLRADGSIFDIEANAEFIRNAEERPIQIVFIIRDITKRKQSEMALIDIEKKMNYAQEIVQMGSWDLNLITGEFLWSENYYRMLGLQPFEKGITNDYFVSMIHPDDKHLTHEMLEIISKNKRGASSDLRLVMPDGNIKWVQDNVLPVFKGDTLVSIKGIIIDITLRKHSEEKKKRQNDALLRLNQFSIDLSTLSSEDDLEIFITRQIKEFTGASGAFFSSYDAENRIFTPKHIEMESELLLKVINLLGKGIENFHAVVSNETYQMITREVITLNSNLTEATFGTIPQHEGAMLQKLLKADRFISAFYLVKGEIYGFSLLVMDKHQPDPPMEMLKNFVFMAAVSLRRKRAEDLLLLSEQTYRGILDSITESVIIQDTEGIFLDANMAAQKMYGYTKEEFIGQTPAFLSAPDKNDLSELEVYLKEALNGEPQSFEFWGRQKDGGIFPKDVSNSLGHYFGKQVNISVSRDITEHRKIIMDLIKAKEHAEESDRLKSAFLANMSHEIRTPMNGILGFAGLLKEPGLTGEDQQEYIRIIEKSGARMLNIINDIVNISKIESGQMEIVISETNINDQIRYLYTFFKPEVEGKGMQIVIKNALSDKDAVIKTDKEKVYAILTNLVKNAIKFTQSGSIDFGYYLKSANGTSELEFFVKDTGTGISEEQKDFIFERFRQGSESLNRNYEGAGLGLAISKAYVEMLGGRIWVESEKEKGCIFYFTLPYNGDWKEQNGINNIILMDIITPQFRDLKVLIVDDEEYSAMLIEKHVKEFSEKIIKVKTGIEAVEECRRNPDIDLVLMDIKMPGIDGYKATSQIRQFNSDVIIIAQSAFALTGDREKALAAGCNEYLSKPIIKDELFRLMNHFSQTNYSIL